jgi:hypothetical protein
MSPRSLAGLLLLTLTANGCSLAGRTFGRYYDDRSITGSVRHGLVQHRTAGRVKVDTFEGTVYLSGDVDTSEQKADAEAAAWRVEGVQQVINDLHIRTVPEVSASPVTTPNPLKARLPGLARVDPAEPGAPALAYDREGTVVATVYVRPLRQLSEKGFEALPTAKPITYVTIYPTPAGGVHPEALVTIVLWHVSRAAAAALK